MEAPVLALRKASADEYCRFARQARFNEFWWYFHGAAPYRGFSKPFQDRTDRWWYGVKPGFAWPVDFFTPFSATFRSAPRRRLLGWQFPVDTGCSDSCVTMNVIHDLSAYDLGAVNAKRRNAIRQGFRQLEIVIADPADAAVREAALEVWNSHVQRTSWNRTLTPAQFDPSWRELSDWPGTTLLCARAKDGGSSLCAWLLVRAIDDTVFMDTLASHTDRLAERPNDAVLFACLSSARQQGIRRAHYALKSSVTSLEWFKESLGFVPYPFPTKLHLRFPVRLGLEWFRPALYRRLRGEPDPSPPS